MATNICETAYYICVFQEIAHVVLATFSHCTWLIRKTLIDCQFFTLFLHCMNHVQYLWMILVLFQAGSNHGPCRYWP